MQDEIGKISIDTKGLPQHLLNKYAEDIHILLMQGVFDIKNGKAILNFDSEGKLQEITFDFKKWRKKRS